MIKLRRIRSTTTIPPGLCGTNRCKKESKLLKSMCDELLKNRNNPNAKPKFSEQYWRGAREFLVAESGGAERESSGKCGYCESPPHPVTQGQVDHFRPKNIYWWLAYCYENFVYSCPMCNQRKSDSFPIEGDRMSAPVVSHSMEDTELQELVGKLAPDPLDQCKTISLEDFERSCQAERPLLISPYSYDPELLLKWIPDEFLEDVEVQIKDGANPREKRIFDTIKECYRLNREGLKRRRWERYEDLLAGVYVGKRL